MIHFLVPRGMARLVTNYLEHWGRDLADRTSLFFYEDLPTWRTLPRGTYVLTGIDQLYPPRRLLVGELHDQLLEAGARVLNSPRATLLRLELLEELYRRGLNRHRALRASDDPRGLRFPVFLHEEHRHTGSLTPLLRTPADLESSLAAAVVRGQSLKDLLVIEYCDTADAEGIFRKYSAFVVGSEIIAKAVERGRDWMLKRAGSEYDAAMMEEEEAYVFENPHEPQLRNLFEISHTEFGRIDYSLKDGAIQTWEINLLPTIFRPTPSGSNPLPERFKPLRQKTDEHFYRLFQRALEAIDGVAGKEEIPIRYSPEGLRQPGPMTLPLKEEVRFRSVRSTLRPLRRLINRIVRAIAPVIAGAARRVK